GEPRQRGETSFVSLPVRCHPSWPATQRVAMEGRAMAKEGLGDLQESHRASLGASMRSCRASSATVIIGLLETEFDPAQGRRRDLPVCAEEYPKAGRCLQGSRR